MFFNGKEMGVAAGNQLSRLTSYLEERQVPLVIDSLNCLNFGEQQALLLVDHMDSLRGAYGLEIKEVDRAIVEVDLLQSLMK